MLSTIAFAAGQQDHNALKAVVSLFVQQQTADLGGKVVFNVDDIDTRVVLTSCSKVEAFLPAGSQLIGRVSIGVRCLDAKSWHIFIPVQIRITRNLLVSARALTHGQVLHNDDLAKLSIETTQNTGMTDDKRAIGKVLRFSIAAGTLLNPEMMRDPYSVKQGQSVRLTVQGDNFILNSSGIALNDASEGDTVQIRTVSGRVISGIASEEGTVQIYP